MSLSRSGPDASGDRPNFLLIMTDQQRADHLGCYGNRQVRTPNLDALAARSVLFERCYVNSPVCMPNRATLATGRMPSAAGARMNGVPLPLDARTFMEALRDAGYDTVLVGKAHLQNMTDNPPTPVRGQERIPRERQAFHSTRSGDEYEMESIARWRDPEFQPRLPYYGFSETHFCLEHGDEVGGDFARWLPMQNLAEGEAPGPHHALSPEKAIAAPQAWRTSLDRSHYPTSYMEETTCSWLWNHASKKARCAPFFIQCSFPDPHHPFTPPEPYWSMYRPENIELPASFHASLDEAPPHKLALHRELAQGERKTGGSRVIAVREEEARQAIALNYGSITMIDDAVGRILETLEKTGLADNTVVIFLSDHGDYMGDHGLLFKGPLHYRSIIRMPFLWKDTPGSFQPGRRRNSACAMDLAPSILDRAGVDGWHGIQGRSLLDIIRSSETAEQTALASDAPILIEEQSHRKVPGLPDPPRVRTLISGRWRLSVFAEADWGELYDLEADPGELHNRFGNPEYATIQCELLFRLGTEMARLSPDMPLSARMA